MPNLQLYYNLHSSFILSKDIKQNYKTFNLKNSTSALTFFKGCVGYIFASLFCMSKKEHL